MIQEKIKKIIRKTPIYKKYWADVYKKMDQRNEWFKLEGKELLQKFSNLLNEQNVLYWLEFGTLLGYYRDHAFIPYDLDLDFGAKLEDAEKIREILTKGGFKLIHEFKCLNDDAFEECYQYKHTTLDVFYFREYGNTLYCNSFGLMSSNPLITKRKKVKAYLKRIDIPKQSFKKTEFYGCNVIVPEDPTLSLCAHYGKNFMTPDPNYNSKTDATNVTIYDYSEHPSFQINHK